MVVVVVVAAAAAVVMIIIIVMMVMMLLVLAVVLRTAGLNVVVPIVTLFEAVCSDNSSDAYATPLSC